MNIKIVSEHDRTTAMNALQKIDLAVPFTMSLKRYRKRRTLPQNSLYWLWLSCIADETGDASKDLHLYFTGEYLPTATIEVMGKQITKPVSTKKLNTKQFTDYLNLIEVQAAGIGITLLHPEDKNFTEFYEQYFNKVG